MFSFPMGPKRSSIELVPSTIDSVIRVKDFFIPSLIRNTNIIIPIEVRSPVENEDPAFFFGLTFEDINRLF